MSKKVEREPDLIEFKVNYTLDQDLPVEKYFMAYNATEALRMFARAYIQMNGGPCRARTDDLAIMSRML